MELSCSRWWNDESVAVVSGGSKGIGLEVCKQLADKGFKVVLTAREATRGLNALHTLRKQGFNNVHFHPLDVTDQGSIATLASWLSQEHGGLDVLVNNAAIGGVVLDKQYVKDMNVNLLQELLFEQETPKGVVIETFESAKACLDTNYYGAKHVTEALIPLLQQSSQGARIVNVGSYFGQLHYLRSTQLQQELSNVDNLSEEYIDELLETYLNDAKCGNSLEEGKPWPLKFPSYSMSKLALHTYTRLLARDLEKKATTGGGGAKRLFVNCVHPGHVRTELSYFTGRLSAQEGAANVVKIALLSPQDSPTGHFFHEGKLAGF